MSVLVPVTFRFSGDLVPGARQVSVVGAFNGWDSVTHRLTRTANGDWTTTIYLTPGRTVYGFWVDGSMWLDPEDDGRVPNAWGSEYSIRFVGSGAPSSRARTA